MEDTFSINAVALVEGKPLTLGLKDLLQVFIDHRIEVVKRRSIFRKAKAQSRLNLVDGLLKAIVDIDKVIKLIRSSEDANVAKEEANALLQLIDIAVKSGGIQVAKAGVVLSEKILSEASKQTNPQPE